MSNYKYCRVYGCRIIVLIVLLFCNASIQAHPFLWKVSGAHEFYMFGTIHLPDPRVTTLPEEVNQALADSDSFYAELDLSEENTMLIKQSMWLPEKKSLYDYLTSELEADISGYLRAINKDLNLEFFAKQKIWVLAITLTVLEQQLKYPGHPPLDTVLYDQAVALGLTTGGLETVDEQLSVFEKMSVEQQLIFLEDTVNFMKLSRTNSQTFIEQSIIAYLDGDLDALMDHLMSYMKDNEFYEQLLDRLINQRNLNMANKMLALVSQAPEKKYFFAVGAGHFWGTEGIHSILEEQGYVIETIE